VLERVVGTSVNSFSLFDGSGAIDIKDNISSLALFPFMEDTGEGQLCHLSESLVASVQFLDQVHPVNDGST